MAGPRHAWIIPPQATTTELSTYGVRTVDVEADEDVFVPGFEYHFMDGDHLHTQIPEPTASKVLKTLGADFFWSSFASWPP